ncbi:ASCH domain-containing protein [Mesobacillus thioparans]|uniref:ASCH domain-containing protein n=1 Tax=Mesobacillus thioparans TaxID=370439 RepID=UPI0039EF8F43
MENISKQIRKEKKVEVRLNNEKRRKTKVADSIEFVRVLDQYETLKVEVKGIRKYDTFESMYENSPFEDFDSEGWTMKEMIKALMISTHDKRKIGEL